MDLLDHIPEQYVAKVMHIVNNDTYTKEQKLTHLARIVDGPLMLRKCEAFLNAREAPAANAPSSFISLLPSNQQTLASMFIQDENIAALDTLILSKVEDRKLRIAYLQWKSHYKTKKYNSMLAAPRLKETNVQLSHNKDLMHRLPKETNIVFLGGTGTGKSTLINALINYLRFDSIDEAIQQGPTVLIPFVLTDYCTEDNLQQRNIVVKPTVLAEIDGNEVIEAGESATQSPRAYHIHYKVGQEDKLIRIVDTPGVGDTKGQAVEKLNMEKVLSFLSQYEEIHAFCITMISNEARRTVNFKYCLNELLIQLHSSAAKNIMFCLTNGATTQYRPGEAFNCLQTHTAEVREARNVEIAVDNSTVHCFENDCFHYVCGAHFDKGRKYTDVQRQLHGLSWKHSSVAAAKMLSCIGNLRPHQLVDTVSINNCRAVIAALSQPLAEIYRNQATNQRLLEEKVARIEQCQREGKNLEEHFQMEQVSLKVQNTPYPVTVCTFPKCVVYKPLIENNNQRLQAVHKECHLRCYLQNVERLTTNNPRLKSCAAMGGDENCRICGCNWSTHMHIYYKCIEEVVKTRAPEVEHGLLKNRKTKKRAKLFLEKIKERMAELEEEMKRIRSYCAEFARFLHAHALLHYNDKFDEYIDRLIEEERGKVSVGALDDVLQDLIKAKEEYAHQILLMTMDIGNPPKTLQQINQMIEELKDMKINGSILRDVQKIKLRYTKEALNRSASQVSIGNKPRKPLYPVLTPRSSMTSLHSLPQKKSI